MNIGEMDQIKATMKDLAEILASTSSVGRIRRLPEPIPLKGQQGMWNWEPPKDWECVICEEFVVGGGLCINCMEEQTELAMDEGLI